MSRHRKRTERGLTLIEIMTSTVVLALLMTMFVSVFAPIVRSQNQSQAKLDTVQAAAVALYRIQRDLRQTYFKSAWACTTGAGAACSQPTAFSTTTNAIALLTAYHNGTGQFQVAPSGTNIGQPNWQGVTVYWLDANGDLSWAFYPFATPQSGDGYGLSSTQAATAVAAATTGALSSTEIALNIQQLEAAWNGQANIISLQMQAQSNANGSVNETTYRSDVLARQ